MNEELRQTGRTTRLLEEAKRLASDGRAVYVVASSQRMVEHMREMLGVPTMGIKIETEHSLGNLDWKTMTLRGAHPNVVVLADHHAIESTFARMLDQLHRFDLPNPGMS